MSSWNKDKKLSDEHRKRLSEAKKGKEPWNKGMTYKLRAYPERRGVKISDEQRKKIIEGMADPRVRKKISESKKGKPSPKRGVPLSKEQKIKVSKSRLGKYTGEDNHFWQGGVSKETYGADWHETLRRAIRERDNYTCRLCGKQQGDRAFDVHHIDYNKKNCAPNNLITLCRSCHLKTNFNREKHKDRLCQMIKASSRV